MNAWSSWARSSSSVAEIMGPFMLIAGVEGSMIGSFDVCDVYRTLPQARARVLPAGWVTQNAPGSQIFYRSGH
jgi:hypothetical protein